MFCVKSILCQAKNKCKTIVFPEAGFSERIVTAGKILAKKQLVKVVFIGDESALILRYKNLKGITIINPKTSSHHDRFVKEFYEIRKSKGITLEQADALMLDPFYFATMLVHMNFADGMVGGVEVPTARNLKPALQIIKAKKQNLICCSCFLFYGKNRVTKNQPFFVSDAGLVEFPNSVELESIASMTAKFCKNLFKINPRVAFLSYSTNGSASSDSITTVKNACELFKAKNTFFADGEVQLDTALLPQIAKIKLPKSHLTATPANVLIFPDINAGNIAYKSIQHFGGLKVIGPIVLGLNKPVNDLSRSSTVNEIINMACLTSIQSEKGE
ncbi:MAG: phosphate acyltransferase [Clostridia bacterium]